MTDFEEKDMESMGMSLAGGDEVDKSGYYRSTSGEIVRLEAGAALPDSEEDVTWEYVGIEKPEGYGEQREEAA